jgi:hypothetical protein
MQIYFFLPAVSFIFTFSFVLLEHSAEFIKDMLNSFPFPTGSFLLRKIIGRKINREKQHEQATINFKQNIYVTVLSFTFIKNCVVSIATGYRLDDRGVGAQVPVRSRIFSSPHCPDWPWGPPCHLANGYQRLFPLE